MSEIFISHARSMAKEAQAAAEALRALGYGAWRDDELPAHRNYADVFEERLRSAKVVVVRRPPNPSGCAQGRIWRAKGAAVFDT